jgi:hypothetical protein
VRRSETTATGSGRPVAAGRLRRGPSSENSGMIESAGDQDWLVESRGEQEPSRRRVVGARVLTVVAVLRSRSCRDGFARSMLRMRRLMRAGFETVSLT